MRAMTFSTSRFTFATSLLALAAFGCPAVPPDRPPPPSSYEFPEWVNKGSGAFGGDTKIFYGVGAASGIRNASLARTAADNRARAEISKILETYSASLMKDYSASTTAGDFSATSEEQQVTQAVKTFSANTISGAEIVDHWIDPVEGSIYALARLDVTTFGDRLAAAHELNAAVKERVKRAAEKAFADLETEEAKRPQND